MKNRLGVVCTLLIAASVLMLSGCNAEPLTDNSVDNSFVQTESTSSKADDELPEMSVDHSDVVASATTTVENGGEYVIDKEITGTVVIDTKEKLTLVLKNATIKGENGPALYVLDCKDLEIRLEGENTLTDGAAYTDGFAGAKGTLFSEDDIFFSGDGKLEISANYAHGLVCDDGITINGGDIRIVSAVKDAVHANDFVEINGGSLTVQSASGDGIHCESLVNINGGKLDISASGDGIKAAAKNVSEDDLSAVESSADCNVNISGGVIKLNVGEDGIQADTALNISGGSFDITTTGVVNKVNQGGWGEFPGGGGFPGGDRPDKPDRPGRGDGPDAPWGGETSPVGTAPTAETSTTQVDSSKGLKAGNVINISGGSFNINATDDTVHSNGTVTISGGNFTLESGDDGIHADGAVVINNGKINITGCYEGIEGMSVEINDGEISLVASDDGINAADGSASNNRPGQANSNNFATINGGKLYINAEGDGLDSNGTLTINGGTVLVDGPTRGGNGAIDADGTRTVNGGVLIAAGPTDMLEAPQSGSKQNCAVIYTGTLQAGTTVALKGADGNTVLCYKLSKSAQTLVISAPELKTGESYTLYKDVTVSGTAAFGGLYYGNGISLSGGSAVKTFKQSSVVTTAR